MNIFAEGIDFTSNDSTMISSFYTLGFKNAEINCLCVCVRLAALVKDYCGNVSEKSVQMNFALIYELLDEVLVSPSEHVVSTTPNAVTITTFSCVTEKEELFTVTAEIPNHFYCLVCLSGLWLHPDNVL